MRKEYLPFALPALLVCFATAGQPEVRAQNQQAQPPAPPASALSQSQGLVKITLDDAIQMALAHNHTLLAARTTIQQSEAQETTANLRPNPVLLGDTQFLPIFEPDQFSSAYMNDSAQFDLGLSYLFE